MKLSFYKYYFYVLYLISFQVMTKQFSQKLANCEGGTVPSFSQYRILHPIRVVEQGNYHMIEVIEYSRVQLPMISMLFIP